MLESIWVVAMVGGALIVGVALGFFATQWLALKKLRLAKEEAEAVLTEARTKQKETLLEAKEEAIRLRAVAEAENRERRSELQRQERRLAQREENLDRRGDVLERRERNVSHKEKEAETLQTQLEEQSKKQVKQLEFISGMSSAEAKEYLLNKIEAETRADALKRLHEAEARIKEEADQKAREIVAVAIQRCATDVTSETTVSVVPLPNDEMKGRLIGREGRNIRALESATGVDLIIDDTPEAVTLSTFDPVRREVARVALTKLILDGRIHPARIEEVVEKSRAEVEATIKAEGERAAYEVGAQGLHPDLIKLLGRLKYRYSYGQNVLVHSLEVAHLSGMLAAELGADVDVCRTAGLLHDLGKAMDHEAEGPHARIGAELVQRYVKSPEIVSAIAEHHGEERTMTLAGSIVSAADAISGSRPGARRESLDHYLKRLEALENVANSFAGVEKSFAIQAGREIRIMVKPEEIDDLAAMRLARDIVKKIEESLDYPGQIKVTVIRETRSIEFAK